jgi:two-component sensor histidine kinase
MMSFAIIFAILIALLGIQGRRDIATARISSAVSSPAVLPLIARRAQAVHRDPAARVDAADPPIMLTPLAAQNIGLALHELAANAIKYGALSSPEGRIVIRWEVDDRQMPNKFRLSWQWSAREPANPSGIWLQGSQPYLARIARNKWRAHVRARRVRLEVRVLGAVGAAALVQ